MNNVKSVATTNESFGLPAGTVLSRLSNEEPFVYKTEHVGDGYVSTGSTTISADLINKVDFEAVEWFEPRKTNRMRIAQLEAEVANLQAKLASTQARAYNAEKRAEKLTESIETKREEFAKKFNDLSFELSTELLSGERMGFIDEAMTVYHNLIDYSNKLLNE